MLSLSSYTLKFLYLLYIAEQFYTEQFYKEKQRQSTVNYQKDITLRAIAGHLHPNSPDMNLKPQYQLELNLIKIENYSSNNLDK